MDDKHQDDPTLVNDGNAVDGEDEAPEPLASTYAWTPSGAVCGACGTEGNARWRDDGRLVCEECKDW